MNTKHFSQELGASVNPELGGMFFDVNKLKKYGITPAIIECLQENTIKEQKINMPDAYVFNFDQYIQPSYLITHDGIRYKPGSAPISPVILQERYPDFYKKLFPKKNIISKEAQEMTRKGLTPTDGELATQTSKILNIGRKYGKGVNVVGTVATAMTPGAGLTAAAENIQFAKVASSTIPMISASALLAALTSCNPDNLDEAPKFGSNCKSSIEIQGEQKLNIRNNQITVGGIVIASRTDGSEKPIVDVFIDGQKVSDGFIIKGPCTITVNVSSPVGSISCKCICNFKENQESPSLKFDNDTLDNIDLEGGESVDIDTDHNKLTIGGKKIVSWTCSSDKYSAKLYIDNEEQKSGYTINKSCSGKLEVSNATSTISFCFSCNVKENKAPEITVYDSDINVFGGKTFIKENDKVKLRSTLGDITLFSRIDEDIDHCNVNFTFENKGGQVDLESGDIISESGIIEASVTNAKGIETTAKKEVICEAISGLNKFKNWNTKVDEKINLLDGLKFADGAQLNSIEIIVDNVKCDEITKDEANNYKFGVPGKLVLNFIVQDQKGNRYEIKVGEDNNYNLTISPLESYQSNYEVETMDDYTWHNPETGTDRGYNTVKKAVPEKTWEFFQQAKLVGYASQNLEKSLNMHRILAGETPLTQDCENVGESDTPTKHADAGYRHIKCISPNADILSCCGGRKAVENYVKDHSNEIFVISRADADRLARNRNDKDNTLNKDEYNALKRLLELDNLIIINVTTNTTLEGKWQIVGGEGTAIEGAVYNSASVFSNKNNKITVPGFSPEIENFAFHTPQSGSRRPVGFSDICGGNIIMPGISLLTRKGNRDASTESSFPSAYVNGLIGCHDLIIMANRPGITLEKANTILQEKYLRGEKYKYADDNGEIKDGENWYFINDSKFNEEEFLCKSEFSAINFSNQENIKLPSHDFFGTTTYEGLGIQFEVDGDRYSMSEKENQSLLKDFLSEGKHVDWYRNRTDCIKHGGKNKNISIESYFLTPKCTKMPNVECKYTIYPF